MVKKEQKLKNKPRKIKKVPLIIQGRHSAGNSTIAQLTLYILESALEMQHRLT